jgi:parvulin-like peptidyl-prolyl isomerase
MLDYSGLRKGVEVAAPGPHSHPESTSMRRTTAALASAALLFSLAAPIRAEIIEQVLVKVNGDIITKTELESRQISALRQRMNQDVDPEDLKNDEQLRRLLAEVTPQILVDAIDELLMVQLAKERGYRLRDEQFKEWITALRRDQNLEDEQKFQAALQQEGMTLDDLRRNVERSFMIQQVQRDEVGVKLTITEEEARQYYRVHTQEFAEPANVTLREILIEVPGATKEGQASVNVAADDQARAEAQAVRARVLKGEDFAAVASEVSAAPSNANGGLIGPFTLDTLSESLQGVVGKMKPGEVTPPIRTTRGYQIFKLETLKEASVQPFERVRDLVAERVHEDRQQQEIRRFLSRVRGQALIEWKNADLKRAYEQTLAESVVPTKG